MEFLNLPKFNIPEMPQKQLTSDVFNQWVIKNMNLLAESGQLESILKKSNRQPVNARFILKKEVKKEQKKGVIIMKHFLLFLLLVSVSGCASMLVKWRPYPGFETLAPTEKIEIFEFKPDRPFVELGHITVQDSTSAKTMDRLIKKGKEIGADAFIILSRKEAKLLENAIIKGVAIKWKTENEK